MRKIRVIVLIPILFAMVSATGLAEFKPGTGSIKGYMVGDFYSVLSHHNSDIEGQYGFWFRRIFLTYDNKLSDSIKVRLRFEMNSAGDYETSELLTPFIKDAWVSFSIAKQELLVGIMSPPTFTRIEQKWGYRPLEKTPLDLHSWTSTRDFGVFLTGGEKFSYQFMLGNGSANKSETNTGKKIYGSVGYHDAGFSADLLVQHEAISDKESDIIYQLMGVYSGEKGYLGAQYAHRTYRYEGEDSLPYNVFSIFAVYIPMERWEFVGRYDRYFGEGYRTDFTGHTIAYIPFADNSESNFFIGSVTYKIHENVWLMPNIKFVLYPTGDSSEKPKDDFYINLSLYFKY